MVSPVEKDVKEADKERTQETSISKTKKEEENVIMRQKNERYLRRIDAKKVSFSTKVVLAERTERELEIKEKNT